MNLKLLGLHVKSCGGFNTGDVTSVSNLGLCIGANHVKLVNQRDPLGGLLVAPKLYNAPRKHGQIGHERHRERQDERPLKASLWVARGALEKRIVHMRVACH